MQIRGDDTRSHDSQWKLGQLGKEKEKPEDNQTAFTGGKVVSESAQTRQERDRTQSMGWVCTHI